MQNTETPRMVKAWQSKRSGIISQIFAELDGSYSVYWAGYPVAAASDLTAAIRKVFERTPSWGLIQLSVR